jgi:serine/threonine protein kinase
VPDSVKVLDFGLVKHFGDGADQSLSTTAMEEIVGTPHFISPEALKNPALSDARSDLYALGALAYYLVTGHHVFEGATIMEVCHKQMTEAAVPPSVRAGKPVCPQLEAIILQCLEKDPAKRPQSAKELATLLMACPRAGEWTLERRAAWWIEHRQAIVSARPASSPTPTAGHATVRIALAERTP